MSIGPHDKHVRVPKDDPLLAALVKEHPPRRIMDEMNDGSLQVGVFYRGRAYYEDMGPWSLPIAVVNCG